MEKKLSDYIVPVIPDGSKRKSIVKLYERKNGGVRVEGVTYSDGKDRYLLLHGIRYRKSGVLHYRSAYFYKNEILKDKKNIFNLVRWFVSRFMGLNKCKLEDINARYRYEEKEEK
jgi:hypothetical protein